MKQNFVKKTLFTLWLGVLLLGSISMFGQASGVAINWDKEVGCQTYSEDGKDRKDPIFLEDIADGVCIRVCEKSIVTYTLSGNLGPAPNTQWTATGGTILSSSDNICIVQWGTVGNGGLTFVLTTPNGVINKTLCMEKITIPKASFTVETVLGSVLEGGELEVPGPKPKPKDIYACVNQVINFENTSTVATEIVSYYWDFGDGTSSTAFEPSHSYSQDGTYVVTLTVYNSCNCSSSYRKTAYIKGKGGFEILCPGVVCEGETVTYTLPFEGQSICKDKYVWNSAGTSHEPTVDQHDGSATVTWDAVGPDGFGYLTFVPTDCELECLLPTTIKIPVIKTHGTIHGDAAICVKSQSIYSLPQWPSTDFHWTILGDPTESMVNIILSDQRNEVVLQPNYPGTYTLMCTYENTLLHCGGTATFQIVVSQSTDFEGPTFACAGTTVTYHTLSGSPTTWVLRTSSGAVIATGNPNPAVSFTYTFNTPGSYSISVGASGTCPGQQKNISVLALPAAPTASVIEVLDVNNVTTPGTYVTASSLAVCPNAPYTYRVPNNPTAQYHWTVTNGTIDGSPIGNEVIVNFNGTAPAQVSIVTENLTPIPCSSAPVTVNIPIKKIEAQINDNQPATACSNSENNSYRVNVPSAGPTYTAYAEGESYNWTITPSTAGSVTGGQNTGTATIMWNNVTSYTPVDVAVTITKCTLTETKHYTVTLTPIPVIHLGSNVASACSGDPIQFTVYDVANNPITVGTPNWNFGYGNTGGALPETYTYYNTTASNISHNVTVNLVSPNGCTGTTNTANVSVTIFPGPPATASLNTEFNAFCLASQISAELTVASTILSGTTYQWYNNSGAIAAPDGQMTTLTVTPAMGFGTYYFIATNTAGCHTRSNNLYIIQFCGNGGCGFTPDGQVTNQATKSCSPTTGNRINLAGTTTGTVISTSWNISGPTVSLTNYTGTTYNPPKAGVYHLFYVATYQDPATGATCSVADPMLMTIPYIPDLAYNISCPGNNTFNIGLVDKSSIYSLVQNAQVTFYYRPGTSGSWTAVSGTAISSLAGGNYQLRIVVTGDDENGNPYDACEKIISMTLATVPNQTISFPNPVECHDTAVPFTLSAFQNPTDSYIWTFETGAQNTLYAPQRVFSSSGLKTVAVTITNQYGCHLDLTASLTIPPKCFNGTVTPLSPKACKGAPVTLTYTPSGTECNPTQYVWSNGQNIIIGATTASIIVTNPGFYWVKVKRGNCVYDTPNRVSPTFYPLPSIKLDGPSTVCENNTLVVDATSNTTQIDWSVVNGGVTTAHPEFHNSSTLALSGLAAGTYTVVATATSAAPNSCTASASHTIIITTAPAIPVISQEVVCPGADPAIPYYHINLSATSDVSGVFNWSNGVSGDSQTVTDGGPFQVRVTANGCSSTAQVDVPKSPEDFMWIFPSGCQTRCNVEGQNTLIGPRLPVEMWAWLFNGDVVSTGHDFTAPLAINTTGTYTLVVNNGSCTFVSDPLDYTSHGCEKCPIKSVNVDHIAIRKEDKFCSFDVSLKIDSSMTGNLTLTAPNNDVVIMPTTFTVNAGIFAYPFVMIPIGTNFAGGTIHLLLTATDDSKPCTYDFTITLPSCGEDPEHNTKAGFIPTTSRIVLAPNPAKEQVTLYYQGLDNAADVVLYDLTGRLVATYRAEAGAGELVMATNNYPAGVYIVVVRSKDGLLSQQKLVVE